ncbi:hypothetical protein [Nostoc sp. LEGE 12450]|uniref:hypothetical protein n=1 Tax=Nostoc sp. LEGE 12450 TaxID=1828643 RepID=UPI00187E0227|nr:hypothetical protein [Nostoc sp. LEGE 12450]MBE8992288.1 hypothetical protein [Nostoc sp. LEGE 12450]
MTEPQKAGSQENTPSSGNYETTVDESKRKTGDDEKSNAKPTATPEAPENDSVAGSPNQGTESR